MIRVKNSGNDSSMGMSFRGKGVNPSYTPSEWEAALHRIPAFASTGSCVSSALPFNASTGEPIVSDISPKSRYSKKQLVINGKVMSYLDEGKGDPIVFLHGNPTSSFLWRNVMPHAESLGRVIAPDLIGMGDSEKLDGSGPDRYTFVEHREYLDALLETLDVRENEVPKLFVNADPGTILTGPQREFCRSWNNRRKSPSRARTSFKKIRPTKLELRSSSLLRACSC